jgi:SAM-dependent methyltransferase
MTRETYDTAYFHRLARIEDEHFWFRFRNGVIARLMRQIVAGREPDCRVLEVGCGNGNALRHLQAACPDARVLGMDPFWEGLRLARQRAGCSLVLADIQNPPFRECFAAVGLFDVLEHLPDDRLVLKNVGALLVGGGTLFLTVPAHMCLWSYFDEASHHRRRYSREQLRTLLHDGGFQIEYLTEFMFVLFPLAWIVRRLSAFVFRRKKQADAKELSMRELRVVPVWNGILGALLGAELPLIARRLRIPLGSSLLAIARKP